KQQCHAGDCQIPLNPKPATLNGSIMEKLHLPILIEIDEDGLYIVSCPLFKGCHSWGQTIDEAMENIREVIEMCLEETEMGSLNTFVGFRDLEVIQDAKASCD
ncbi:MAG: type II toxin-antitoxin system HicB family antitoxin, partial [Methanothrix sp.]|nr:type II toxin-antitoxin system HicB family antitoxin [Methanothrix sp.]